MNPVKTKTEALEIQSGILLEASLFFEAANHPLRRQLLCLLDEEERLPVAAICRKLQFEEEDCFRHLSVLCRADLVVMEKEGKQVFYAVNYPRLDQLCACAEALLPSEF